MYEDTDISVISVISEMTEYSDSLEDSTFLWIKERHAWIMCWGARFNMNRTRHQAIISGGPSVKPSACR